VITIPLGEDAFQYFDDRINQWRFDPDVYTIRVGSSSRDLRMEGKLRL
jgi:hypothetical protein